MLKITPPKRSCVPFVFALIPALAICFLLFLRSNNSSPAKSQIHPPHVTAEKETRTQQARYEQDSPILKNGREFISWMDKNPRGNPADEESIKLAKQRGDIMSQLVTTDPQRALDAMLPLDTYAKLPTAIRNLIEKPFSTAASLRVGIHCGEADHAPNFSVTWAGKTRRAFFAGARNDMMSKDSISISGVEIDNVAAIRADPVWILKNAEIPAAAELFGTALPTEGAATAMIAGEFVVASLSQLLLISEEMLNAESTVNPSAEREPAASLAMISAAAPIGLQKANSGWTLSDKKVLFLNLMFSDSTAAADTQSSLQSYVNSAGTSTDAMSYGAMKFSQVVVPGVLTLPNTLAHYAGVGKDQLLDDALVVAASQGIISSTDVSVWKNQYDIIGCIFPQVNAYPFSGAADLGGRHLWINGRRSFRVLIHEFGHNYGLQHASRWNENNASKIPPTPPTAANLSINTATEPRHVEYGDWFDYMGSEGEFGVMEKNRLWWIDDSKVASHVDGAGNDVTYRIYRFDEPVAASKPLLGIKAQVLSTETFWISYRGNHVNTLAHNGAHIVWQFGPDRARVLDMTPGNTANYDVILPIGQTYTDPSGMLRITPIAKGGTGGREWLDVRIVSGTIGNSSPSLTLKASPTNPVARESVRFTAMGADPDGDPLTYHWNFDDGRTVSGATSSFTHSFPLGGSFTVTAAADDGLGGYTQKSIQFEIPEPLLSFASVTPADSSPIYDVKTTSNKAFAIGAYNKLYSGPLNGPLLLASPLGAGFMLDLATDGTTIMMVGYSSSGVGAIRSSLAANPSTVTTETLPASTRDLYGIVYGNGIWVAVGSSGTILTKSGTSAWTKRVSGTTNPFTDVAFNNGVFMAVGYGPTVRTSTDGITWSTKSNPPTGFYLYQIQDSGIGFCVKMLNSFAFTNDQGATWHAQPWDRFEYRSTIWTGSAIAVIGKGRKTALDPLVAGLFGSTDGINWSFSPYPAFDTARDIARQGDQVIVAGDAGKFLTTQLVETPIPAPPTANIQPIDFTQTVQIMINSTPGQVFDIFRSKDLSSGFGLLAYESNVPAAPTGNSTIYTDTSPLPLKGFYKIERTTN